MHRYRYFFIFLSCILLMASFNLNYRLNCSTIETFFYPQCFCTVDMNVAEYQYLADHLKFDECRKLIASLHYQSYDLPNAVDEAERKVSKEVSCLKQLLHWNSAKGEGKGQTHEVLQHRLRQLQRPDLADWLGKTVFHELALDLERSMNAPFNEFSDENKTTAYVPVYPTENIQIDDPTEWTPVDTIAWTLLVSLLCILFFLIGRECWRRNVRNKDTSKSSNNKFAYKRMGDNTENGSDSEEIFDIRSKIYN